MRTACMLLTLFAVNAMATDEITTLHSQKWLSAFHGFFYGLLTLALIVNTLIWATTRQKTYGLFVGLISFSILTSLSTDNYFHQLDLTSWTEQKEILNFWFLAGMTSIAILFTSRILCVRHWSAALEWSAKWMAIALLALCLPALIFTNIVPFLWELTLYLFVIFGFTSLIVSVRNLNKVRSLQNSLITLAFFILVASQWFGMCIFWELLPNTEINHSLWKLGLITFLTLLQVTLVIKLGELPSEDTNRKSLNRTLNASAFTRPFHTQGSNKLHEKLIHDFKTPLAIIDSSIQSLVMLEREEDPQRQLRYDRIRRAVSRLNVLLIESIITENNSRVNTEVNRTFINLPKLFDAVLKKSVSGNFNCNRDCSLMTDQNGLTGHRRIQLIWKEINQPELIYIDSDVDLLHPVLRQVLDSSIKYSLPDTPITIEIKQVQAPEITPSIEILIRIFCEKSIHISDLSRYFEPYYHRDVVSHQSSAMSGQFFTRRATKRQLGILSVFMLEAGNIHFQIQLPIGNLSD